MDGMFRMFSNIFSTEMMRRCSKIVGTPSHHPFLFGIFHEKKHPAIGVLHSRGQIVAHAAASVLLSNLLRPLENQQIGIF